MGNNISVAFSVINYKTPEMTISAVENILALGGFDKFSSKIFVLENGSRDNSAEVLSKRFNKHKNVEIVISAKNLGFAGGQDYLKKFITKYNYVALINSDCLLKSDWLEKALEPFNNDDRVAASGGRAYEWDDDNQPFDESNDFYSFQSINPYDAYAVTLRYGDHEMFVDALSGAALMFDVKKALSVGYFDKDYFLYFEETDLEAKLKRAGYLVQYNPEMKTWHKIGASSGGADKFNKTIHYFMHRNRFYFGYTNFDEEFKKYLFKRYIISTIKLFNNEKNNDLKKIYGKSLLWLFFNIIKLNRKRKKILQLGDSYTNKLNALSENRGVTVVITCYNYGVYLSECVESVLGQKELPKRIIIINDGSTDNTKEVLRKYKDVDIIEIVNQNNIGVVASKNKAMKMVDTKWIIYLDADDKLDSEYISKTLDLAIKSRSDLVYTDSTFFGDHNKIVKYSDYNHKALYHENYMHNSALMRTDLLNYIGGYSQLDGYEDWEMYIRYSKLTHRIIRLPAPILYYRQHDSVLAGRNQQALEKAHEISSIIHDMHPENTFVDIEEVYKINNEYTRKLIEVIRKIKNNPIRILNIFKLPLVFLRDAAVYILNAVFRLFGV